MENVQQETILPRLQSHREFQTWYDALPDIDITVDERVKKMVKTSIRLNQRTIDGFTYLAKQKGLRSSQTLMKLVLESYLARQLPPDF